MEKSGVEARLPLSRYSGIPSKPKVADLTMKVVDDTTLREAEVETRDVEIHLHASAKVVVETCALIPLDADRVPDLTPTAYRWSGSISV